MKIPLSHDQIATLPIHDADLLAVGISTTVSGEVTVLAELQLDPEESLQPFREIGIETRRFFVGFGHCWQITSNIYGCQSPREQVCDWDAKQHSRAIEGLHEKGLALGNSMIHHKFEMSGGSTLEIISEQVWLQPASEALPK